MSPLPLNTPNKAMYWNPPKELMKVEDIIQKRTRTRRKFFVFVREHRDHIFDKDFQDKLIEVYSLEATGKPAIPPALLGMATLLQAYCGVGDQEAVELSLMDRRWQMALDHFDCEKTAFSQGTLFNFRQRLIQHDLDKALLDKSVEIAENYGGFCPRKLRLALDSSPLFGAGRVEDTFNLLGHTLAKAVKIAAKELNKTQKEIIEDAKLLLVGQSSLKSALDLDWGDPNAKTQALEKIIEELERWKIWIGRQKALSIKEPPLKKPMELIEQIIEQDTEPEPEPGGDGTGEKKRLK